MRKLLAVSNHSMHFILLMSLLSFFADMTYQGAISITGQFLTTLGANVFIIGLIAGFGEMFGYLMRLLSGFWLSKSQKPWVIAKLGYATNLIAIPLLATAMSWSVAAVFIILERLGKGLRMPARDTMLSFAADKIGSGRGFAIHNAFDHAGAVFGPLIISIILLIEFNYRLCFTILAIPAAVALLVLFYTSRKYREPQALENQNERLPQKVATLTKTFWFLCLGASLLALGYADFPIIAFILLKRSNFTGLEVVLYYALAMTANALFGLVMGYSYDKGKITVAMVMLLLCAFALPLLISGQQALMVIGIVVWGMGLGAFNVLLKAIIRDLTEMAQRGMAYGIYNTFFGIAWFIGSATIGYLYTISKFGMCIFSVTSIVTAVIVLRVVAPSRLAHPQE